jgi:subtilisin family serine protease
VSPNLALNDPYLGSEWHLAKIGAPIAWDAATGSGVTIAILDTGVDGTHPDLASRMVPGWNFYDNNSNTADVYDPAPKSLDQRRPQAITASAWRQSRAMRASCQSVSLTRAASGIRVWWLRGSRTPRIMALG